jgi:hypothetical protein
VFLGSVFHHGERFECRIFEIPVTVVYASRGLCAESRVLVLGEMVLGLDLAGEETAGEGVIDDNVDAVAVARGDGLDIEISGCASAS